jgi:hypothetical protein
MPDTGERHSIPRLANAKEAETVHESKDLASKTKQREAKTALQNRFRGQRNAPAGKETSPEHPAAPVQSPVETETQIDDREASARMVDEGDPNKKI